jgi:hypothetical protein
VPPKASRSQALVIASAHLPLGPGGRHSLVQRIEILALREYLNISITVHVIPDAWYPELSRLLVISGRLGELGYSEQLNLAAIFVPGSLPLLVLTLTIRW